MDRPLEYADFVPLLGGRPFMEEIRLVFTTKHMDFSSVISRIPSPPKEGTFVVPLAMEVDDRAWTLPIQVLWGSATRLAT